MGAKVNHVSSHKNGKTLCFVEDPVEFFLTMRADRRFIARFEQFELLCHFLRHSVGSSVRGSVVVIRLATGHKLECG